MQHRDSVYVRPPLPVRLTQWARQAQIRLLPVEEQADYLLAYENERLQLHWLGGDKFSPLVVEHPRQSRVTAKNLLLKAIGKKSAKVADLTAGVGLDAMTMSLVGKKVHCLERCAPVAMLLYDGLCRFAGACNPPIELMFLNSLEWLQQEKPNLDVIYIDTMFSGKKSSVKSNKTMQILRHLAGADEDAELLVNQALASNANRVVVKQDDAGPVLVSEPDLQYSGKTVRFDVYIKAPR